MSESVSPITQIVKAIHDEPLLAADANGKPFDFHIGKLDSKRNFAPPKISWIPIGGTIGPTEAIGPQTSGSPVVMLRQVRTRNQLFRVHIHGVDFAQTEQMLDGVVGAVWRQATGAMEIGDFEWQTQSPSGAEYAVKGELVILEVTIKIPIHDTNAATAALTGIPITPTTITTSSADIDFESDLDGTLIDICPP